MRNLLIGMHFLFAACGSNGGMPDGSVHQPDAGTFVQLRNSDGQRLKLRWAGAAFADGAARIDGTPYLFDTMLGVACTPAVAEDGVTRCIPDSSGNSDTFFAESTCQVGAAPSQHALKYVATYSAQCPSRATIFRAGPPITVANLHIKNFQGNCIPITTGYLDSFTAQCITKAYSFGIQIPPYTFVEQTAAQPSYE